MWVKVWSGLPRKGKGGLMRGGRSEALGTKEIVGKQEMGDGDATDARDERSTNDNVVNHTTPP